MRRRRTLGLSFCAALALSAWLPAQEVGFDDNFFDDPSESGDWVFNGVALWVPPPGDVDECLDPNAAVELGNECSLYTEDIVDDLGSSTEDFGGYMLITPALGSQAGNVFRAEPDEYDNFRLEVILELRDGSIGGAGPADGMVVTVVGGSEAPNRTGTGGGGMGAPCVGVTDTEPQMAWEFDDWNCNTGDDGNRNHVAFSYSPTGFPCSDAIQPDVKVEIPEDVADLHTEQPPPADPNRYKMTVFAQNCGGTLTVATDLEALDFNGGVDLGRLFTHVVENFEPFEGYLGVTASTGGAQQNHILHSATLIPLPDDFCLQPAAGANRTIAGDRTAEENCGEFLPGDTLNVSLELTSVREGNDCCSAAGAVTVTDAPPVGWEPVPGSISDGGSFAAGVVTWMLDAGDVTAGKTLSYNVVAEDVAGATVPWGIGSVVENVAGSANVVIGGMSTITKDVPFDDCGGIRCWNILGAFTQIGGAAPGEELMRGDYLTDGEFDELSFVFEPGKEISPDFFGDSAADGIFLDGLNRNPKADEDTVTVFAYNGSDSFINLNNDVFPPTPDNVMAYGQIYVFAEEETEAFLGVSSDDAVQVILNEEEVWINNVARGGASACNPQDVSIEPVTLLEGENRLIIKVFEGGGDWNWAFRFQDDLGNPITEGISVSKFPTAGCRTAPLSANRSIDASGSVIIGARERDSWSVEGETLGVAIALTNPRGAGDGCEALAEVTIVETFPVEWSATNPSHDGAVVDNTISWTFAAGEVPDALTYDLETAGALVEGRFGGSMTDPGTPFSFGIKGENTVVYAPAPFGRGDTTAFIDDDFDEHTDEEECPDGWVCNGGNGGFDPFMPGVTQEPGAEGRLRITNNEGNIGAAVIYTEPIDLTENSFSAEFDVFFSHPGGDPADGLTFVVLDADDPLTQNPDGVVGGAGGGTGYSGLNGFAVEFDSWQNNAQEPSGYNTNDYLHMGVIQNGIVTPHVQTHIDLDPNRFPTFLGGDGWPEFMDFGGVGIPIHVEIEYNNGHVEAYISAPETSQGQEPEFERTKVLDTVVTFDTVGGQPVAEDQEPVLRRAFVGFTGGTGGAFHNADVDDVMVTLHAKSDAPPMGQIKYGDANNDGSFNIADAIFMLNNKFGDGGDPSCLETADVNADNSYNIADAIFALNRLFGDGPPPIDGAGPDGIDCTDPNPEGSLGCVLYDKC